MLSTLPRLFLVLSRLVPSRPVLPRRARPSIICVVAAERGRGGGGGGAVHASRHPGRSPGEAADGAREDQPRPGEAGVCIERRRDLPLRGLRGLQARYRGR